MTSKRERTGSEIAVIGIAGRFPSANTLDQFWENLRAGVESISFFTPEELEAEGLPSSLVRQPNFVPALGRVDGIDLFDAHFFGFTAREAETMDPQQRLFLETAWEAIERAGYNPDLFPGKVGVYAGTSMNTYNLFNLTPTPEEVLSGRGTALGNEKDFLATRVSYHMNLRGPGVTVQTACSTSLVAVHFACQGLLNGECDMALAGGASLLVPSKLGYLYKEGSIYSPDGHCRAFDAAAGGTVSGTGIGVVVLKRLEDALADGDHIHAVILGSASNNDGAGKVGYTAPSVDGQAEVVAEAISMAGVKPDEIGYIEAHGTGTKLGDPIEVEALTRVFRAQTDRKSFCGIGSLKSNIGHLDTAAGVAGLIKAVLSVEQGEMVPSLHYQTPNPMIDFAGSPFFVNTQLRPWGDTEPRR
ncbi:MAG TPA: polyketide synthase, partial [Symbiobacteriaceae bacterium]|nr:polyketide synthase [Symbiobacteriaceae bacterium]